MQLSVIVYTVLWLAAVRALGACGLVDCILDFVWFFHRISDYSIALQWLLILLLVHFLLWCEEWHFNNYYFNDWGTIVSWTWRTTSLSSLASRLFSQKTRPRHTPQKLPPWWRYLPYTTPLWKQLRNNETSNDPALNGTIFDALSTDMHGNSNTITVGDVSCVTSSHYNFYIASIIASYSFP